MSRRVPNSARGVGRRVDPSGERKLLRSVELDAGLRGEERMTEDYGIFGFCIR